MNDGPYDDHTERDNFIARERDPHGQAAILLVESLLHGLMESSVLNVEQAVEIVATAEQARGSIVQELGTRPELRDSLDILGAIRTSLEMDLPPDRVSPA